MKATGIVRRIDDSGNIIIPVELRRELRIKEGDSVEIFVDDDGIIVFQKYSPIEKDVYFAASSVMKVNKNSKAKMIVIDTDKIVVGGENLANKKILDVYDEFFARKSFYCHSDKKMLIHYGASSYVKYAMPIIANDYVIGAVVCITDEENAITDENSNEAMLTKLTASLLSKHYGN